MVKGEVTKNLEKQQVTINLVYLSDTCRLLLPLLWLPVSAAPAEAQILGQILEENSFKIGPAELFSIPLASGMCVDGIYQVLSPTLWPGRLQASQGKGCNHLLLYFHGLDFNGWMGLMSRVYRSEHTFSGKPPEITFTLFFVSSHSDL